MQNIHEAMGFVLAYQLGDVGGEWRVGGKTNAISWKEKQQSSLLLAFFAEVHCFILSTASTAEQAGVQTWMLSMD